MTGAMVPSLRHDEGCGKGLIGKPLESSDDTMITADRVGFLLAKVVCELELKS
jgi:hypothetical protein